MIGFLKSRSEFAQNVLTLMTGTTIAQAIPIALSPILTRIYAPKEFGLLAIFMSIVSILGVIATMRYELAIVQPEKDEEAVSIVVLSAIIAVVISGFFFICCYVFNDDIGKWLGNEDINQWLYGIPLAVLLMGLYRSLNYWHMRTKQFNVVAVAKVTQGTSMVGSQVGLGAVAIHGGLILGYIMGFLVALALLFKSLVKSSPASDPSSIAKQLLANAKKYRVLPFYSTWGALADNTSVQMPIIMMTKFYDFGIVGMFSLTFRVLNLPMSLISQALSQVLFQKIAQMHHAAPSQISTFIVRLFLVLIAMMVPFVFFIWVFSEDFFAFVFGEPWREAGSMASILVFAVAIRFAVNPLSCVLALEQNIKLGVLWQFIYLVTITATLYIFSSLSIGAFLSAFVVHEIALYILYFVFILKGSKYIQEN